MSRFMLSVYSPAASYEREFGSYNSAAEMGAAFARVAEFNDDLKDEGILDFVGGLSAPEFALTIDSAGKESDGSATDASALLGGFWVIAVDELDEARGVAQRAAQACGQAIEVRQFEE